ncbi:gliding motility lipoprotein GldH [Dokdonia sp. Hel_I_53]|uniref:gliding motility lipoprotein GldH n=1 Tax=Dokdonia sp. Hel_I_53 TaxID=1566287 RepID=UPI00119A7EDA|nr:gliding motility lipoprotein GldH [Dokdonia sp. Hel_I_53]TVZ52573.1 protein involved in gliding motility GldH [Dokdonia sp. Hel_I_53]
MRSVFLLVVICMGLFSCDSDQVYHRYESLGGNWNINEPVTLEIKDIDSVQPYNLYITVRNDNRYPYSNLFLITSLEFPQGHTLTDTLEYEMAAPDGRWLGEGFGDIKESKLVYKRGERFRESGTYTFTVEHAVRKNGNISGDQTLKGITEVGLRIEKQLEKN